MWLLNLVFLYPLASGIWLPLLPHHTRITPQHTMPVRILVRQIVSCMAPYLQTCASPFKRGKLPEVGYLATLYNEITL